MGLFGPPDVDRLTAKGDVPGLIKALRYESRESRAYLREHETGLIRKQAVEALGQIGDARAVEPLVAMLNDTSTRHAAGKALVQIGAPAVKALIAALPKDGRDFALQSVVLEALGKIGDPLAVEPLIPLLSSSRYAAEALVQIGAPSVELLIALLPSSDAATALGGIGDRRAVEPLIRALPSTAAAAALGAIGDPRAIEPLLAAVEGTDPQFSLAAASALARLGWKPTGTLGALHLVRTRQWTKCVGIGAPAIGPLIAALAEEDQWVPTGAVEALNGILSSVAGQIPSLVLSELAGLDDPVGIAVVSEPDPGNPLYHSQDAQLYRSAYADVATVYQVDCARVRSLAQTELTRRGEGSGESSVSEPARIKLIGSWRWTHLETAYRYSDHSPDSKPEITSREIEDVASFSEDGTGVYVRTDEPPYGFNYYVTKAGMLRVVSGSGDNLYRIEFRDDGFRRTHVGSDFVSDWQKIG